MFPTFLPYRIIIMKYLGKICYNNIKQSRPIVLSSPRKEIFSLLPVRTTFKIYLTYVKCYQRLFSIEFPISYEHTCRPPDNPAISYIHQFRSHTEHIGSHIIMRFDMKVLLWNKLFSSISTYFRSFRIYPHDFS
jgi:hypothetical protein